MKPQLNDEVITSIEKHRRTRVDNDTASPKNLDELTQLARTMLMQEHLEVSKVRPLFWSMIETYVDRFHTFPFDIVKALHCHLELIDCSSEDMHAIVKNIEEVHMNRYGHPMKQATQMLSEKETLEEEIKALRDSLKYASLVESIEV